MNEKLFNGFEVKIRATKNSQWEAYFPEFPQMSMIANSRHLSLCELYKKWNTYKKNCDSSNKNIPIPVSKKDFTGQINLRIDPAVHQALTLESIQCGVSLNSLIAKILSDSINKNEQTDFKIKEVESLRFDTFSRILWFSDQTDKKIGLKFSINNLGDELRDYGGDDTVKSDNELKLCFSNKPLIKAVQYFISEQPFINRLNEQIQIFECILISHDSIKDAVRGSDIDPPKNPKEFFICRVD